jgi:hypothetical protein
MVFFMGFTTTAYFIYSDICQEVYEAIYENKFPIDNKGMGYLVSCFDSATKASLHSFDYQVNSVESYIKSNSLQNTFSLLNEIKNAKNTTLKPLLECEHVYRSIQNFERVVCANTMDWSKELLTCYSFLFVIILISAISVNRLKPLVDKKKDEIDSMLDNEDAIY